MVKKQYWVLWVGKQLIGILCVVEWLCVCPCLDKIMEKAMAPHSSTLAWKIPWTEEPGRLQSMGLLSRTRLSNFTFTFHFYALEKERATHSSVLAWRIPGMVEPGGLPSMGSHRVRHDWSDLPAAAAAAAAWMHTITCKQFWIVYILSALVFLKKKNDIVLI